MYSAEGPRVDQKRTLVKGTNMDELDSPNIPDARSIFAQIFENTLSWVSESFGRWKCDLSRPIDSSL
jgi:hypothetical protein